MKKFKEVANLYKGVLMRTEAGDFPLILFHNGEWLLETEAYGHGAVEQNIKPLLRPLRSMTEGEMQDLIKSGHIIYRGEPIEDFAKLWSYYHPETFAYLLSHSFDLFNLIESGEAIDKTKL